MFGCEGAFVDRCVWVGVCTSFAWYLCVVASAEVGEEGLRLFFGEILWPWRIDGYDGCLLGFFGIENLFGDEACLAKKVDVCQFGPLGRVLLVVARVLYRITFLCAVVDDTAAVVVVFLLTVDDAPWGERAMDFTDRVL